MDILTAFWISLGLAGAAGAISVVSVNKRSLVLVACAVIALVVAGYLAVIAQATISAVAVFIATALIAAVTADDSNRISIR